MLRAAFGSSGLEVAAEFTTLTGEPQSTTTSPNRLPLYIGDEDIRGMLYITAPLSAPASAAEAEPTSADIEPSDEHATDAVAATAPPAAVQFVHDGLTLELEGVVTTTTGDRIVFLSTCVKLARAGTLAAVPGGDPLVFGFQINNLDKPHESYVGSNVTVAYLLRLVASKPRKLLGSAGARAKHEFSIWVANYQVPPERNPPLVIEFGFDDVLKVELEYAQSKFALDDVLVGRLYFETVRIAIDSIALSLVRVESVVHGPGTLRKSRPIFYHEITDGAPVHGEAVPIRIFLDDFPLTPTYKNIHNVFSVKYVLNIIVVDDADRRYFKQQEIVLWRPPPGDLIELE
ncbi:vacuolar protein sorting-associated protein 26 [Thecamonas trahens ATCC 50062]|uniref:Vacuolar protein sorting-associated protein 26 n=1 Tax=Thecamonas trahens ATCC 50062 TaxID=461836 RepID=A0A0L0DE30_THETB|nr:vacuolar protein sorting-associated protein 26 [Thecamonas trahens ATCC 50062]KNC50490.1 vacuolar protein sorting-associated protein 26 [Thecamonas trahens ATCC 50062]|eukprot:XP_013762386.1 vacuolar protein sorting-associated protein 26 [Thecamonas trahens ATCC 50062]